MEKLIKFFSTKIKLIVFIYALILLFLVLMSDITYRSDSLYYYNLAQECISQNELYPAHKHLYEDYITAPLYINTLLIFLHIYNSPITIGLLNIIIILVQLLLLFKITTKIINAETARLAVLLSALYLNTLGMVLQNYTELFFTCLVIISIYFYSLNKNIYFIISGIFIGAAIAVRPLGWTLLAAIILIQIFQVIKEKKLQSKYAYIFIGSLMFILAFGTLTYSHFDRFEFTSTTGPVNLLIGANDDATGGFNATVHQHNKAGFIENSNKLTYIQKGDFYQSQAIKWIKDNTVKWLLLAPLKLLHAYGWDDIAISTLLGFNDTNFLRVFKILLTEKDFNKALPNTTTTAKVIYLFVLIIAHLSYYFLLIASFAGIYKMIKQRNNNELVYIIILFILFASLMIMITVGTPRYKYPMFILLIPYAAYYLQTKINPTENKVKLE